MSGRSNESSQLIGSQPRRCAYEPARAYARAWTLTRCTQVYFIKLNEIRVAIKFSQCCYQFYTCSLVSMTTPPRLCRQPPRATSQSNLDLKMLAGFISKRSINSCRNIYSIFRRLTGDPPVDESACSSRAAVTCAAQTSELKHTSKTNIMPGNRISWINELYPVITHNNAQ